MGLDGWTLFIPMIATEFGRLLGATCRSGSSRQNSGLYGRTGPFAAYRHVVVDPAVPVAGNASALCRWALLKCGRHGRRVGASMLAFLFLPLAIGWFAADSWPVLVAMGLMAVLWVALVFSLAFGAAGNAGVIGNFDYVWLRDVGPGLTDQEFLSFLTIPFILFCAFQMTFAIITPALSTGATADRRKLGA